MTGHSFSSDLIPSNSIEALLSEPGPLNGHVSGCLLGHLVSSDAGLERGKGLGLSLDSPT